MASVMILTEEVVGPAALYRDLAAKGIDFVAEPYADTDGDALQLVEFGG